MLKNGSNSNMFESGYSLRVFKILEDDLVNFLNYISIEYYSNEEWKKIYSPKLAEYFIRIGSQVDTFLRNWCVDSTLFPESKLEELNYGNYQKLIKKYNLDNNEIILMQTEDILKPFYDGIKSQPNWLIFYNNVKHNAYYNIKEGNLFNVIESLSALFLINCSNENTKNKLIEYGFYELSPKEHRDFKNDKIWFIPRSPARSQLFECKYKPKTSDLSKYKKK